MKNNISILKQQFMIAATSGELEEASNIYLEMRPNIQDKHEASLVDSMYMTLLSNYKKDNL